MDSVTITFDDDTQATGNLLVGAEGAHSPTREYLVGAHEAALMPSPVVASVSICKISREAAQRLRELHSRYVITFHPKGIFTFMSSKSNQLAGSNPCLPNKFHSSRLLIRQSRRLAMDDDADMAFRCRYGSYRPW